MGQAKARRVLLALSDMHSGHKLGLLNPETVLTREDDEGQIETWQPELGVTQTWLWECYQACLGRAAELAGKAEIVVVHAGDATNGLQFGGNMADVTMADQYEIAVMNLLPLVKMRQVRKVRLVTGTPVHVPDCAEARVAVMLANRGHKDVQVAHHERLKVDEVLFDLAHHGPPPGVRDWLRGNTGLYYLKSAVYADRRMGVEPARAFIRGHFHEYVPTPYEEVWNGEHRRYDLTIVPSFCGFTEHARKVTRSSPQLTVGMVAYVIEDGRLAEIAPLTYSLDLRLEETL